MCARFGLGATKDELESFLGLRLPFEVPPAYNIAPTESTIAMTGTDEVRSLRWGFLPPWADAVGMGVRMINARSETVLDKPAFKAAFAKRRCIIPASGFFEWEEVADERAKGKTARQPHFFHLRSGALMGLAGFWGKWERDGQVLETFSILTTTPNQTLARIHDRMPVILDRDDFGLWLSADEKVDRLLPLLRPCPDEEIDSYLVTRQMNHPTFKDAQAIQPVEAETAAEKPWSLGL